MDFNNTQIAFAGKSKVELKKSYWLFKIIGWNWLIKISPTLLNIFLPLKFPIPIIRATIFQQFCGGETIEGCNSMIEKLSKVQVKTILDYSVEGTKAESTFDQNVKETIATIEKAASSNSIPFSVFKVTGFARFELLEKIQAQKELSTLEKEEYERAKKRVDDMCNRAHELQVPIFIDAEETWIQNPIDELALEMMKKYNTQKAIVFNTLQFYRWDRVDYLNELLEASKKDDFKLGIKLVRGAYIEKERERAIAMNYPDPMQKTKVDTDKDFDEALRICIENINQISFCCASHNEKSTLLLADLMKQHQLAKDDPRIYFAQLLGMSDHISMNLGKSAYNVAKYVPYGPVKDVTPYLIRRAQENTSIAGQTGRELSLIIEELNRRKHA